MVKIAKYGKPEEMQKKIDEYFQKFEDREPLTDKNGRAILTKEGNPVYKGGLPTSSGLALYLGFESRSSLWDYAQKPTFASVITCARLRLQTFWEPLLSTGNYQGARYMLSNLADNWQDPDAIAKQQSQALPVVANIVFIDKDGAKAKQINVIDAQAQEVAQVAEPLPIAKKTKGLTHATKNKQAGKPKSKTKARAKAKN